MLLPCDYVFEAIGTQWSIETIKPMSLSEKQSIQAVIADFDQAYSRFRLDSLVMQARAKAPGVFTFPRSIVKLYDMYAQLEQITDGAVNPLVGEVLEQWGYDATYSLRPSQNAPHPPAPFVKTVRRKNTTLTYIEPALLDIGAIGKGYLVDLIATEVKRHHPQYVVDGGGDMAIATDSSCTVGLEHPLDLTKVIGSVYMQRGSICGSSPNRRSWGEGVHHIIDARTGKPLQSDIIATWAIADSTLVADALTTALFFVSPEKLYDLFGNFHHAIMRADGRITHNLSDIGILYS